MTVLVATGSATPKEVYHLQVLNYENSFYAEDNSLRRRKKYKYAVDCWLERLWEVKGMDPAKTCLLECTSHCIDEITDSSGTTQKVVKLAFKLKKGISSELNAALSDFCKRVFSPDKRDSISQLSGSKICGLLPVEGTPFANIWKTGFMLSTFQTEGSNLESLFNSITEEIRPPDWLKAICFIFSTPFTGEYNFGDWALRSQREIAGCEPNGAECFELDADGVRARGAKIARICELFMESAAEKKARVKRKDFRPGWEQKLKYFAKTVREELDAMKEKLGQTNPTDISLFSIGDSLYGLAQQAAALCTANKEAMQIYRDICAEYASTNFRGYSFCIGWATVAGLTMGAVGLASRFCSFTPGLVFGPLGGGLAVGFLVLLGIRIRMTKRAAREKERYRKIFVHFFEISKLANNTYYLIRWYRSKSNDETAVDPEVRKRVETWWEGARETWGNAPAKLRSREFQIQDLKITLEETVVYLDNWGNDIDKVIKELEAN